MLNTMTNRESLIESWWREWEDDYRRRTPLSAERNAGTAAARIPTRQSKYLNSGMPYPL